VRQPRPGPTRRCRLQTPPARAERPPARPPAPPVDPRILAARARRLARDAATDWLQRTYPNVFGAEVRPLAIGVGAVIWPIAKAAGITRKAYNDAILRRVNSVFYRKALAVDGAVRFDLEGNAVDVVSPEHRLQALERLASINPAPTRPDS
jgi:hypothetical protein